jgi:hypothetical protein
MSEYRAQIIDKAINKIKLAGDSLNEMNSFALDFDEGVENAIIHLNKVIQYLTAKSKLEREKINA